MMMEGNKEEGKEGISESPKKQMHSLRRFADKTFLRRKTSTDIDKVQTCSSTAVSAPESSWTTVSVPRSHIPTSSVSSRRHTCSSQVNAIFSPSVSPQTKSQIPRSVTMRPSDGFANNVFSGSPTPNQDGRYPFLSAPDQRNSDVGASQRPNWGTHDEELSHCDDTADTVMPSSFKTATFGSGAHFDQLEIAEQRYLRPTVSWPLSLLMQPDRDGDDGDTPTMRQFTNFDEPAGIVDSAPLVYHTFENVTTTHSPPASRYQINSHGMPNESSAWTTELASSSAFAMPNYGDYSFDTSDQTIGLALTTPPEDDPMYDTAIQAAEPFDFVMPERFSLSSEIQDYPCFKPNSEVTEEPKMEVRISRSPHMDEEGLSALRIRTAQPNVYWLGRVTALSDRFRTEAMAPASLNTFSTLSGIRSDSMHDDSRRITRVFEYLDTRCSTQAAKDSLAEFQIAYMKMVFGGPLGPVKKVREKKGVFGRIMGIKGGVGK